MSQEPATASFTIAEATSGDVREAIPGLADVLIDCVEGGASVGFMLPIARQTALDFWSRIADAVETGEVTLLIARDASRLVVGTVHLRPAGPENQPHRADVSKLLVHRSARRQGIAEALMHHIEAAASARGKTTLVLDTVTGEDAERLYKRLGWQVCGIIPDYALFPDGRLCPTTVLFKSLKP